MCVRYIGKMTAKIKLQSLFYKPISHTKLWHISQKGTDYKWITTDPEEAQNFI